VTIEIFKKNDIPKKKPLIIGLPDIGLVGAISSSYLVKTFDMKEVAFIDSPKFPPILVFHETKPVLPVRFHADDNKTVLMSEVPIPSDQLAPLAEKIVSLAKDIESEKIIMIGGVPVPNRIELSKPKVYVAVTNDIDREFLKKKGFEIFKNGFIAGIYATILKECIKRKVPAMVLLAESYVNYPDPGAAAAALEVLGKILNINIDVEPLLKQEEEIRLKLRELMQRTMSSLKTSGKEYEFAVPLMYA